MQIAPAISVIVPCYKVEKYLRECVDSILKQTFQDFELILVDDGSPDASGKIIDEYARKYAQIKAIHQTNAGVTAARRTGVEHAKGEWITFVDGDDELPENSLQVLYEASSEKYDMVIGFQHPSSIDKEISVGELRHYCITEEVVPPAPWGKLIRRKLFADGFAFNIPREIVKGEDVLMNIRLSFVTNKPARFVPAQVYRYRNNPRSAIGTFRPSQAYEIMYDAFRTASIPKEYRKQYTLECLCGRMNGYFACIRWGKWREIVNQSFKRKLLADLRATGYPLTSSQRWLLKFPIFVMLKTKFRRALGRQLRFLHLLKRQDFR